MKKLLFALFLLVSITASQAQQSIDIYHHVPFIPQPTNVSCWSTSISMILWWRDNEDAQMSLVDALTPSQVAQNSGYWAQYFNNGLSSYDSGPLDFWGFESVQPMSFPVTTLISYLRKGPVWVAYNGCSNPTTNCGHAVVLIGIRGDGTPDGTTVILHDPDDGSGTYPNLGVRDRQMPFNEFVQRLNNRAQHRLSQPSAQTNPVNFLAYLK